MASRGAPQVVARARAAVGGRFRLHGRDPGSGLDCVGLVVWAQRIALAPTGYALRSGDPERTMALLAEAGLGRVAERRAGDVLLAAAGPGQLHLGIWTGTSVIHADAMARRVVERPGEPPWPIIGYWRRGWRR